MLLVLAALLPYTRKIVSGNFEYEIEKYMRAQYDDHFAILYHCFYAHKHRQVLFVISEMVISSVNYMSEIRRVTCRSSHIQKK